MSITTLSEPPGASLRVAVEGCGHGKLDAIYASVEKACEVKGWDGVDLLIIGGDFQAVRDRLDLNVTAMPPKYRQMGDFYSYYWGQKVAPYLTIFIGGNHEASNHLFELYYGGWVAPNIYYLGAANVIKVGPITIAGMSGIWKGRDYRKPHYERLPYNSDDLRSIYHVRELDVRKLLAFRSQVDIGLSHDWPNQIERLGDTAGLLRHKPFFMDDMRDGKLGSNAVADVMDRLRPPHWFSAHMHTRFTAVKKFNKATHSQQASQSKTEDQKYPSTIALSQDDRTPAGRHSGSLNEFHRDNQYTTENTRPTSAKGDDGVSAWRNFHQTARKDEAEQSARILQEQRDRRDEAERTGIPLRAGVKYVETYKKVIVDDDFSRELGSVTTSSNNGGDEGVLYDQEGSVALSQLDGYCPSKLVKRRRESSGSRGAMQIDRVKSAKYTAIESADTNGMVHANGHTVEPAMIATNPDAIDVDTSDSDDDANKSANFVARPEIAPDQDAEDAPLLQVGKDLEPEISMESENTHTRSKPQLSESLASSTESTIDNQLDPLSRTATGHKHQTTVASLIDPPKHSIQTNSATDESVPTAPLLGVYDATLRDTNNKDDSNEVSDEMRAKLAALSCTFAESEEVGSSPVLPQPEAIKNDTTRFLALSKPEPGQQFLQLMEIHTLDTTESTAIRPVKIHYVPEWLAILRVFEPELALAGNKGGTRSSRVPRHRGDTYYRERILEEEKWILENVVKPGDLKVPENFSITIPPSNVDVPVATHEMPREVSNPQTSMFCKLIGIENKFDISEGERDARIAAGPFEASDSRGQNNRGRGGRGDRGGGFNHRGDRGGRGRGRGRARH